VTVVKLAPDGTAVARYAGEIIAVDAPAPWVVVRAVWTFCAVEVGGLWFQPGDVLHEWFSPAHPFNAFAVYSGAAQFRGWYGNVTFPARLDSRSAPPQITWHDLYVDLVGLPDGSHAMHDDDELAASGLEATDPELYRRIIAARAELVWRFARSMPPFAPPGAATGLNSAISGPTATGS
jgi:hypothetical protein